MTVQRTPIMGITRTPIVGTQRVPIVTSEKLDWDEVYKEVLNYIKFAARQVYLQYQPDLYSPEDLFQEGQLLLYFCYLKYQTKPKNEFIPLFKTSLWRKLRELGKARQFITVDISDAYDIGYEDNMVEDIYEEYMYQQMAEMLENTPIALTILKEFVNPSTRTLWEAKMDVARKQMLKSQGLLQQAPTEVVIRGTHIQRALEITPSAFQNNFKAVKAVVAKVYSLGNKEVSDEKYEQILQKCV